MSVMAGKPAKETAKGRNFIRTVGPREHYIGIGLLCLTLLFCTAILIRGLAPRGVLWGANEAIISGEQSATVSGSSSLASLTRHGASGPGAAGAAGSNSPGATGGAAGAVDANGQPLPAAVDANGQPLPGAAAAGGAAGTAGGGTAAAGSSGGNAGGSHGSGAPSAAGQSFLPLGAPAGFTANPPEHFTKDNAFEKIDGGVQIFIDHGMLTMEQQKFSQNGQDIDVTVYDMGEPLRAFGMLGEERNGDLSPVDVGQDGYAVAGSTFFRAGRYYAKAIASDPGLGSASLGLARALAAKMPKDKFDPPGAHWFPSDGLKANSLKWVLKGGLATEFLSDAYIASYQVGSEPPMDGFLAKRGSAAEAESLLGQFKAYYPQLGAVSSGTVAGQSVVVCNQSSGGVCLVFAKGAVCGGVSNAGSQASAEKITAELVAAAGKM